MEAQQLLNSLRNQKVPGKVQGRNLTQVLRYLQELTQEPEGPRQGARQESHSGIILKSKQ